MSPGPLIERTAFSAGMRAVLPLCLSIAAYGVVWGVLARQAGLTVAEAALMSGLVFAGASQFVALDLWSTTALPVGAIVFAALIVNLRFMLMTATARPLFAGWPVWRATLAQWLVSDENWALTMAEVNRGRGSASFLIGAGFAIYLTWLASTVGGTLVGSAIDDPTRFGLDFAFTATFLALLFGSWRGAGDLVPWIVAAIVAVVCARLLPGQWYVIAGGLLGSLAGALWETRSARRVA